MSRKPVVELAAKGGAYGRQAMWEAMRRLKRFTLADLYQWDRETVKEYVQRLEAGGFLQREGAPVPFRRVVYLLVRDVGLEAPRLQPDGSPSRMGQGREHMWRAMKMLPSFSFVDLAVSASTEEVMVSELDAKDYVKHLLRARYLAIVKPATAKCKAVYKLHRNTGPKPPMVTRAKVVFDPNLNSIAWHEDVDA